MSKLVVRTNADNTITVRFGRKVEHISMQDKTKSELFDAVKYAAYSKGARFSDVYITQLLFKEVDE